jgi:hypothetical protein
MKTTTRLLLSLLLALSLLAPMAAPGQGVPAGAPRPQSFTVGGNAERPDIRPGDRWSYRVTDKFTNLAESVSFEVTTVTENRIHARILQSSHGMDGITGVWDRDWNPLVQGAIEYKPFYPTLQFPLEPGKRWRGVGQWYNGSGVLRHDVTSQVTGWERVAVPAGTFDAVRIVVRGGISESGSINYYAQNGSISSVIWYAPSIGQIVKKEIDHRDQTARELGTLLERWELTEYRLQ